MKTTVSTAAAVLSASIILVALVAVFHHISLPTVLNTPPETANPANPAHRHLDLKLRLLQLTNIHRTKAGLLPLRIGQSPAPQLHAQAALDGCYNSHWDAWGLRPSHRHALSGGTGYSLENIIGLNYCVEPQDGYASLKPLADEVETALLAWMESPGHRAAILHPSLTTLHMGLAHDPYNIRIVQHFEAEYVQYDEEPSVSPDGILRIRGEVSGASLPDNKTVFVRIGYEPPPTPLSQGQLARTYSLCIPMEIARVLNPTLHTSSMHHLDYPVTTPACIDPAQTDPDAPAPTNPEESNQTWSTAKRAVQAKSAVRSTANNVTATRLDTTDRTFHIEANISKLLEKHGAGVYSVIVAGQPDHMEKPAILAVHPIFWKAELPPGNPYSENPHNPHEPEGKRK